MNTRDQLNHYLRGLETRLRWLTVSKGAAIALGVALLATLAMVWFTNALAFSSTSITIARVVLFLALAAALGFALVLPLLRLNQKRTANRAESTFPEFNQRLLTYIERGEARDPMLDLLASDAISVANKTEPERVAPRTNTFAYAGAGGLAGAALIWLILAAPGFLGYGSSLLWAGLPKGINDFSFYDIRVEPGNNLVRRKRYRLRVSLRIPAGAGRVLRRSGRRQIQNLQAGRRRPAWHQEHQGHLSLSFLARFERCGRGSGRRSARRRRHRR
jgi:hypothetical protein